MVLGWRKVQSADLERKYRAFYEGEDQKRFGRDDDMPEQREITLRWLERAGANKSAIVLELGCGRGLLADVHPGYVGLEFSRRALTMFTQLVPRVNADMQLLPFRSNSVHFVFSWAAIEHVPRPELVFEELIRVLRPGGVSLLAPAWNCRSWASKGLPIKSFQQLDWKSRLEKLTIPVRDSVVWRAGWTLPVRLAREVKALVRRPLPFTYRRLNPNLTEYVYTDCDAFTSMDPHAAILFFQTRGWQVLSHPGRWSRLVSRHEPVVVRKPTA